MLDNRELRVLETVHRNSRSLLPAPMIGAQNLSGDGDLERLDRGAFGKGSNFYNGGGGHDVKQERAGFPSSLGSQGVMRVGRLQWHTIGEEGGRDWRIRLGLLAILVTLAGALVLVVLGGKRETVEGRTLLPFLTALKMELKSITGQLFCRRNRCWTGAMLPAPH